METPGHSLSPSSAFHHARSQWIDAFVAIEEAITAHLNRAELSESSGHFTSRLTLARKIGQSPKLPKVNVGKLADLLDRCHPFGQIRNDIVHSRMQVAPLDNATNRVSFTNARDCQADVHTTRNFTLAGLRTQIATMSELAFEMRALLLNPNS